MAIAARVSPATIRDWHRRGLLTRYGTARQARWDLAQVYTVATRAKKDSP